MRLQITGAATVAASLAAVACAAPDATAAAYTVRPGDTLSGIAARSGIPLDRLVRSNGLRVEQPILIGTTLEIPGSGPSGPSRYGVRWGDTLSAIAARHGVSTLALAAANGLRLSSTIFAGSTLRLPGDAFSAAAPAPPSSATPTTAGGSTAVPASIARWAAHYGVDVRLARAMAWQESGFQHGVVSSAGAQGVMQVMPDTWDFVETVLIGAPVERTADGNVRVGVAYLRHLLRVFGGDEERAVGAYFQGDASMAARGPLPETRQYVANVLALRSRM